MIARLKQAGLRFEMEAGAGPVSDALKGKTVVISGNFSVSREQIKQIIALHGGKNSGSLSGRTSFLLAGEKPGPEKMKKAEASGVPVISEKEFMEMISGGAGHGSEKEDSVPESGVDGERQLALF